jgi:hypothetical protein
MIRPLLQDATGAAIPDKASYDSTALVSILAERRVTDTPMTTTLVSTVLSRYPDLHQKVPELKSLWLNGEVITTGSSSHDPHLPSPSSSALLVFATSESRLQKTARG